MVKQKGQRNCKTSLNPIYSFHFDIFFLKKSVLIKTMKKKNIHFSSIKINNPATFMHLQLKQIFEVHQKIMNE